MEYKIKVANGMNASKRKSVYSDLKIILTDVGIPMSCIEETTQMWRVQEEIKKLIELTGKVYKED